MIFVRSSGESENLGNNKDGLLKSEDFYEIGIREKGRVIEKS
jgi:hypothetical protein